MNQFERDVLQLIRFSIDHPPASAPVLFPMFDREQIDRLYAIPHATRERIWRNRDRPDFKGLIEQAGRL